MNPDAMPDAGNAATDEGEGVIPGGPGKVALSPDEARRLYIENRSPKFQIMCDQLENSGFNTDPLGENQELLRNIETMVDAGESYLVHMYVNLLSVVKEQGTPDMFERLRSFVSANWKYELGRELIIRAAEYYYTIIELREYFAGRGSDAATLRKLDTIEQSLVTALDMALQQSVDVRVVRQVSVGDMAVLDIFDSNTPSMRALNALFRQGLLEDMSLEDQQELLGLDIETVLRSDLSEDEREYVEQLYRSQLGYDTDRVDLKLGTFNERIDNPDTEIGLIKLDNKIVGMLILSPDADNPDDVYGSSLTIDPAFIGKGCMLPYVQQLLETAGENRDITGDVFDDNGVALNFYKKLGFVVDAVQPTYQGYPSNGLRLRRPASATERAQ